MHLELGEGVLDLVGEDAGGQARYDFLYFGTIRSSLGFGVVGRFQDVGVDKHVITKECELARNRVYASITGCDRWSWHECTLYFMFLNRPPTEKTSRCELALSDLAGGLLTERGEMDDMGRLVLLEECLSCFRIPV